jgi:hypothetical protein
MSYKYSKGSQVIGDLKAADDTQRDTLIDFGEDQIQFQTSGSTKLTVDNNGASVGNFNLGVGMGQGGSTDGGSTPTYTNGEVVPKYRIHVVGDINNGAAFSTETYADSTGASKFRFIKARGNPGSPSAVNDNDEVGRLEFYAHTGSNEFKLSGMIAVFADADGDGKMSFRATHNGADNEAFYLHDNRVYFVDQVRIGNVIAPETNGSTNVGGATARFEQIHGNNFLAYESVKIDDTFIYGQDGYGVTFGIDYVPHTDVPGDDANSSHMSALTYASSVSATRNVAFNLVKTGSHTVGLGTYGTGNSNENLVLFGQYNTTAFEFRNNVGVQPLLIQSGSLLMKLSAAGDLGIGAATPIAKLDVAGKIAITSESSTPSQPADGKGFLYTKSDGKLYWRSHDVTETDLTSGGGGGGSGASNRSVYMGYVSLQTTSRVVSYDLGTNLGSTANNNFKGMIIVPFDGILDTVIVSPKGADVTTANFGNVTVSAFKNQSNFASGTDVVVAGDNFQRKTPDGSTNPKIFSGEFDFNLAVAAGDLIQIKVGRSSGGTTDTLVTVVFTES